MTVLNCEISDRDVNSLTRIAVEIIKGIFKGNEELRFFAEIKLAAQILMEYNFLISSCFSE